MKSVCIRSLSDPFLPASGLNTERWAVSPRTKFKCRKIRTRKTLNTDTFHAVITFYLHYLQFSYFMFTSCKPAVYK